MTTRAKGFIDLQLFAEEPEASNDTELVDIDISEEEPEVVEPETEEIEEELETEEPEAEESEVAEPETEKPKAEEPKEPKAKETVNSDIFALLADTFGEEFKGIASEEDLKDRLAATKQGIGYEEYKKQKEAKTQEAKDKEMLEKARKIVEAHKEQEAFEKQAQADLAELKKHYPELATVSHLREIKGLELYAKLRGADIDPVKAYKYANEEELAKAPPADKGSKEHLGAKVVAKAGSSSISMPKADLIMFRELFPKKTDKELAKLWKRTKDTQV